MIMDNIADPNVGTVHSAHGAHGMHHRISWSAIIIGALVGTGLGFLLNLFGMAIGLSAFSAPTEGGTMTFAIGGFLGLLIAVIAGMLAAGYAAGYVGRMCCSSTSFGVLYGFATWTLTLIFSAMLVGAVSNYVAVYANRAANVAMSNDIRSFAQPQAAQTNGQADAAVSNQLKPNPDNLMDLSDAAWMAFVAFVLFFIGALSSCIGALWGMGCCKREHEV